MSDQVDTQQKPRFRLLVIGAPWFPEPPSTSTSDLDVIHYEDPDEIDEAELEPFGIPLIIVESGKLERLPEALLTESLAEWEYMVIEQEAPVSPRWLIRPGMRIELEGLLKRPKDLWTLLEWLASNVLRRRYGFVVGTSTHMCKLCSAIEASASDLTTHYNLNTLIMGDPGTGKDEVARAIHRLSSRRRGPFVQVDCTAISATVFEAELFGVTKDKTEGALQDSPGLIKKADGGTLYIDEIAELDLYTQKRFLRFCQDRVVRAIGAQRDEPVDVQIIAATNRPIVDLLERQILRADLFHRLQGIPISVPTLQRRSKDVPYLIEHFLRNARLTPEDKKSSYRFYVKVRNHWKTKSDIYDAHAWPDNIRELEVYVRWALGDVPEGVDRLDDVLLRVAEFVRNAHTTSGASNDATSTTRAFALGWVEFGPYDEVMGQVAKRCTEWLIREALSRTDDNNEEAYKLLGLSRSRYFKLKKDVSDD